MIFLFILLDFSLLFVLLSTQDLKIEGEKETLIVVESTQKYSADELLGYVGLLGYVEHTYTATYNFAIQYLQHFAIKVYNF